MSYKRITREELFIRTALLFALRSSCSRLQVGAVIVKDHRIISTGYNGDLPNSKKCNEVCDITKPCDRTIHAEQNAILFASRNGIALNGSYIFCTHSPCVSCCKFIIMAGIERVYYHYDYRNQEGLLFLEQHGIKTQKITLDEDTLPNS